MMIRPLLAGLLVFLCPATTLGAEASAKKTVSSDHEAEQPKGPRFQSPTEIAAAARAGARTLGSASLLGHRIRDSRADRLGPGGFCLDCPHDEEILPKARGLEGLTESDLQAVFDIPIVLNDRVLQMVRFFSEGGGRSHFARYLDRSFRWIPMMHEILDSYGLPRDLVYVAMIESGFSMNAYSHAHAVGPWQFIPPTAEIYNLKMDHWVDERRDPVKATHAAARFMTWLHREFDDWHLAWAGYNGGPTRVRRNMNRTGLTDYWELCEAGRLPRETCGYVPKIIAAAIISKLPERFGFEVSPHPVFEYDGTEVEGPIDLAAIARLLGVPLDELRALNPELRRAMTPPAARGRSTYALRLPPGTGDAFLARKDELEPSRFVTHESHIVRSGDSYWRIARAHSTTIAALTAANPSIDPNRLRPGMEILVPLPPGAQPRAVAGAAGAVQRSTQAARRDAGKAEVHYTVRAGDSLWGIAARHGLTMDQLIAWNRLSSRGNHVHLAVGQSLIVGRGSSPARAESAGVGSVHVLQPGETLWQLSQRYGKSVDDLRALNSIEDVHSLRVGQTIVVSR